MSSLSPTFEYLTDYCLFCDPSRHGQAQQILLRSDNFYLFAGLGPIVEGYIIIAPDRCDDASLRLRSLSEAPAVRMDELVYLRGLVAEFYRDRYGNVGMSFEHGRAGACLLHRTGTQHCYHAHLCCYPVSHPLWEDMPGLQSEELGGLHDLGSQVGSSPYLFIEVVQVNEALPIDAALREQWDARVVQLGEETALESQYLRRLLAARVGAPHLWNWSAHPGIETVQHLVTSFHDWLREKAREKKYVVAWGPNGAEIDFLKSVVRSNQTGNDYVAEHFYQVWAGREQYGAVGRFLRQFPDNPEKRPRILDAGCGPGTYVKAFDSLGIECVGIDLSEEMLAIGQNLLAGERHVRAGSQPAPPPQFLKMDALDPDFPAQSFDGIWYSAVLVHVPRVQAPHTLAALHRILKDNGVLYLSAQLLKFEDRFVDGGMVIRWEGRVFVYYTEAELQRLFRQAGFEVIEAWDGVTERGSQGDMRGKIWQHYLLKKRSNPEAAQELRPSRVRVLSELGERGILERIKGLLPQEPSESIVLGVGDDCAAVRVGPDELVVATTDPCPQPVISLLGDCDRWYDGWFSMLINLSDLGAMGARPLGILLAIEAEDGMPVEELDRFYAGILEAAKAYGCPVLGGNVKDAPRFSCVGTALGAIHPQRMLRRDAARPGERVVVLGEMGRFWAGVIHRMEAIPLDPLASNLLLENLRRPRPRIREGRALADHGLARCAMDSSDGLTACFYEIARAGDRIDVHVDLSEVTPDPLVQKMADIAGLDVRQLLLAWGDWELVCTVADDKLDALRVIMAGLGCPVSIVGWISEGKGDVWYHDRSGTGQLTYLASERFSKRSYFSHGLESYLAAMRQEPLFHIP